MNAYDITMALAAERRKEYERQAEVHRWLVEAGVFSRKTRRAVPSSPVLFAISRLLTRKGSRRQHLYSDQVETCS